MKKKSKTANFSTVVIFVFFIVSLLTTNTNFQITRGAQNNEGGDDQE